MPIFYTEVDISSILSGADVQGKVIKQTGYTGIWAKQNGSGVWQKYNTQPSGTVIEKNLLALFPANPGALQVCQPCNGEGVVILDAGDGSSTNTYKKSGTWHCGLPPL